jgi:transcriptional regulator with XRE-family HTH domain
VSQDADWPVNPTVRLWQLTETLRQLRERSGLTLEEAAEKLSAMGGRWSRSKLSRIENREQGVKDFDVERLLDAYKVTEPGSRKWILGLTARVRERGYWHAIRNDLPEDFHELLSVEDALLSVRQLEMIVVPGLLQTPEYARAMITGVNPGLAHDVAERRILARLARHRVLTRPNPLQYHVIIDETMLSRPVGSPAVMRGQLDKLAGAAESEHITIQVLPMKAGACPAVEGSFSILTLPEPIPDFGYAERPGGAAYIEDRDEVRTLIERWGILTERAHPPAESLKLITSAGDAFR